MSLKKLLRQIFYSFLSLAGLQWLFPGFQIRGEAINFIIAALVLTGINLLIKPLLKLILLPFNLLSFGMFRWVINVINLWLLTFLVEQIQFVAWHFPGLNYAGIVIPTISFSPLGSLIAGSFILTLIRRIMVWLIRDDD